MSDFPREIIQWLVLLLVGILMPHLVRRIQVLERERERHQQCLEKIDAWMDIADEALNDMERRRKAARGK